MALLWVRIAQVGVFFIPTTFIHFIVCLLDLKVKRSILAIGYTISFLFASLCPTSLMIADAVPRFFMHHYATPGLVYPVAVLYFFVCVIYGLYHLYRAYASSTGTKRNQMKYLFYSSLMGYVGGGANFLPVFNVYIPFLHPFGTYAVPIYFIATTYAIIKHHLMDINIVFQKGVVYSLLVTTITLIYFMFVWLIERIFQLSLGYQSIPLTIFALLTVALLFQPIKNRIQTFVDRYFFKGTVDILAEENERLQEELARGEKLRIAGTLASGIAHEIKNPLTSLKTFTSYLEEKHNDPSYRKKFREIVGEEVGKIEHLIRDLLDFAKPKSPQFVGLDVHKSIDRTFELINTTLAKANISLTRQYHRPNTEILGDSSQLQQAFLNLFLNAMDAMPNGGELHVSTHSENGWLAIKIEDTGCGMTKEQIDHIFEPFYTTKETGTGLGLAITKRIIEDHKGKIKVTSNLDKGSIFEILLPLT